MAETAETALAWILQPISEVQPCGPDLEAEGAPAFIDYYYEAEARLRRPATPTRSGATKFGLLLWSQSSRALKKIELSCVFLRVRNG